MLVFSLPLPITLHPYGVETFAAMLLWFFLCKRWFSCSNYYKYNNWTHKLLSWPCIYLVLGREKGKFVVAISHAKPIKIPNDLDLQIGCDRTTSQILLPGNFMKVLLLLPILSKRIIIYRWAITARGEFFRSSNPTIFSFTMYCLSSLRLLPLVAYYFQVFVNMYLLY